MTRSTGASRWFLGAVFIIVCVLVTRAYVVQQTPVDIAVAALPSAAPVQSGAAEPRTIGLVSFPLKPL